MFFIVNSLHVKVAVLFCGNVLGFLRFPSKIVLLLLFIICISETKSSSLDQRPILRKDVTTVCVVVERSGGFSEQKNVFTRNKSSI